MELSLEAMRLMHTITQKMLVFTKLKKMEVSLVSQLALKILMDAHLHV